MVDRPDDLAMPGSDRWRDDVRRTGRVYAALSLALIALMVAAAADVVLPVFGVDEGEIRADTPDGGELRVTYPAVTRPALAAPFAIEVYAPDGFDAPIELAVSRPFVESWDENGFYPSPDTETGDRDWVVYEFDPPDGTTLRVFYDGRIEPGRQSGMTGRVQLREDGGVAAEVRFDVEVRP